MVTHRHMWCGVFLLAMAIQVPSPLARQRPPGANEPIAARFQTGQTVRALNINPVTHTRLPRYVRGRTGTIERDHGVFAFMETTGLGLPDKPQHVYSVRFAARELWGREAAPQDSVYLDLYDDYLEPV